MDDEPLIVEDVLLLMLDDRWGVPAGAGTLHYTLGGAVMVELALRGLIDSDGTRTWMNNPTVRARDVDPPSDPLLRSVLETVARRPRRIQTLLLEIGTTLRKPVLERLAERGLVRRERRKFLGLIPTTTWPAGDTRHETALRDRIVAVLEDGDDADPRTAAVIAMISASNTLVSLHPRPTWSGPVIRRAKALEHGDWGAAAVGTAVTMAAAAVAASSAVAVATTVSTAAQ